MTKTFKDLILANIAQLIDGQNSKGMETYGRPLEECPPEDYDWNLMIIEELIDALQYQQKENKQLRALVLDQERVSLKEYQELSKRTLPSFNGSQEQKDALTNYAMGLTGEAGEVVDLLKKVLFHGHELDKEKVIGELGDTLHYLSGLCTILNIDLEGVASYNVAKLKRRYPNGFSQAASIHRAD